MYLLDTNAVSELRKMGTSKVNANVSAWANGAVSITQYLSVITVMELETGVLQMERKDPRQSALLRSWLDGQVLPAFSGRILPIDFAIARACASFHVPNRCSSRDALIAATALVHGLTVVTRNISDFKATDVRLLNPWEGDEPFKIPPLQ